MANKNVFNSIQVRKPGSNHFDLTHDVKLTLDMGELIPVLVMDCVPGDRLNVSFESLIRFAPLIAPVMHRMDVTIHAFFVPNRLLWPDWETFITGNNLAGVEEGPTPAHPYVTLNPANYSTYPLIDYMGLPEPGTADVEVNAFPFAAYQLIYNEYYRDQNLIDPVPCELDPGSQPSIEAGLFTMRKRAWEHDYFTAALPFAQKGSAIDIPLGDVTLDPNWAVDTDGPVFVNNAGNAVQFDTSVPGEFIAGSPDPTGFTAINGNKVAFDPRESLVVQATTINDLRRAFRLQEWLEKNARGGTRYTESILMHFGVKSSDARLQRPEYITGTKTPVVISEVLNTTGTDDLPQGNMSGHGISVVNSRNGSYFCEEHGWVMAIMSVLPRTAYQQGVPRMFSRFDRFDYYWPEFANIGEQEVKNQELYVDQLNPNGTFGYVPRYSEYKYMPSRVAGDFKTTLDFWTLGRIFTSAPQLNEQFVTSDPTKRIFAVVDPGVDSLYCHVLNKIHANRPMPKFGTPTL